MANPDSVLASDRDGAQILEMILPQWRRAVAPVVGAGWFDNFIRDSRPGLVDEIDRWLETIRAYKSARAGASSFDQGKWYSRALELIDRRTHVEVVADRSTGVAIKLTHRPSTGSESSDPIGTFNLFRAKIGVLDPRRSPRLPVDNRGVRWGLELIDAALHGDRKAVAELGGPDVAFSEPFMPRTLDHYLGSDDPEDINKTRLVGMLEPVLTDTRPELANARTYLMQALALTLDDRCQEDRKRLTRWLGSTRDLYNMALVSLDRGERKTGRYNKDVADLQSSDVAIELIWDPQTKMAA